MEVTCEYNYSNPTGWFNLSLPHIDLRTSNYQTISYAQYKKVEIENERKARAAAEEEEKELKDPQDDTETTAETSSPKEGSPLQEVEETPIIVRNWFEHKKEAPVLLKVYVTNKIKGKVAVKVTFSSSNGNIQCPSGYVKDIFIDNDKKCIIHLQKVDPTKDWGNLTITVQAKEMGGVPQAPQITTSHFKNFTGPTVTCKNSICREVGDFGQTFCAKCGEPLDDDVEMMENYFGA